MRCPSRRSGHMVPYNVPSSALDMLKRFLSGKPFIDVELPQVRYSSHASKSEKHKGAEKWMNLPDYPKIPKEHNAGEEVHVYDYMANFPSWQTQRLDAPAMISGGNLNEKDSFVWTAGWAFFAGMVVAIAAMQLANRRPKRSQGYQPIPEASLDQD